MTDLPPYCASATSEKKKNSMCKSDRWLGKAANSGRTGPGPFRGLVWAGLFRQAEPNEPKHKSTRLEVLKILEEHASQPDQVKWRQTTKPSKGSPFDK